jgi:hypothetical protein
LTNKHFDKITACIKELEKFQTIKVTQRSLVSLLLDFFSIKKYSFIAPNDSSIYFNFNLLKGENLLIQNKKRSSVFRIYLSKVIQIKSFKKYLKMTGKGFSHIPKVVNKITTKYRTIKTLIPVPESVEMLNRIYEIEANSMHGQMPIIWDRAEDFQVYDKWGNKWLDFSSTIFVANAGHGNKRILRALRSLEKQV